MREKVWYFDLLRVVAAVAVVVIHVLGPYREQLGQIPDWEWITAITFNSFSRWAVPVFIMITGALMLSDERPFEGRYYLKRRVGKVLIPFVVWSVFYAFFSAFSASGTNFATSWKLLTDMPFHETYYHLGFFYYFIPLYLIVPFYQWAIQRMEPGQVKGVVMVWLVITASYLFHIDGLWSETYLLYSGYLILGYCLYKYHWPPMVLLIPLAIVALLITDYMVVSHSLTAGEYKIGRWLSYKTINTAIAAAGVFVLCRYISDKLGDTSRERLSVISRHSLGIYLLHPIFLWPVRNYDWYFANPLIAIPFWTLVAGGLAFASSWLLSRSTKTAWLVP